MTDDRPLLSVILLTYNQEAFVEDAVNGLLSQTYSPLEIILSDDCSNDRTFEIMKEMASSYEGPHAVVLNRNVSNVGIGKHVNIVMALARGEFIVVAGGDDISYSSRTSRLYEEWSREPGVAYVHSGWHTIDGTGAVTGRSLNRDGKKRSLEFSDLAGTIGRGGADVTGCSAAWHRSLFDIFGPIPEDVFEEDRAIPFRALLVGRLVYVDEPLLKYRRHSGSVWRKLHTGSSIPYQERKRRRCVKERQKLAVYRSFRRDTLHALHVALISSDQASHLLSLIESSEAETEVVLDSLVGNTYRRLVAEAKLLFGRDRQPPASIRATVLRLAYAMSPWLERWRVKRRGPSPDHLSDR